MGACSPPLAQRSHSSRRAAASYGEYYSELNSIDGNTYARFVQDQIQELSDKASDVEPTFSDVDGGVKAALGSVSDIVSVTAPDVSGLTGVLSDITQETNTLIEDVSTSEMNGKSKADAAAELLASAGAFLQQIEGGSAGGGMSYVPADFFTTQAASDLLDKLDTFSNSSYANNDYVQQQMERMGNSVSDHDQTRFEDAKKAAEQNSVLEIVEGVGVVIAGAAAIVCTAGAATPVVVAFALTGGATMVFGAADVAEGLQDAHRSFNAQDWDDLNSRSFNFVRDTIFGGNDDAYRATENVLVTACALAGPVTRGTQVVAEALRGGSTFSSTMLSGGRAAVADYLEGQAANLATDKLLNPVVSNIVGGGTTGQIATTLLSDAMGIRDLARSGGGSPESEGHSEGELG